MRIADNWKKKLLQQWPWLLMGFISAWLAIYNGFPLVYPDSGTYINGSFDFNPAPDRPAGYSYFIHLITWKATVWTVPFFQGWILAGAIFRLYRRIFQEKHLLPYLLSMGILAMFSSLPWYLAQIMPDIFTGLMLLAFSFFLLPNFQANDRLLAAIWIFIACIFHLSNWMLGLLLVPTLGMWIWRSKGSLTLWTFLKHGLGAILLAMLFLAANQAWFGHGWRLSRSGNLFITARMAEIGMLGEVVAEACRQADDPICAFKESLPSGVDATLWVGESSLLDRLGGWEAAEKALQPTVRLAMSKPDWVLGFLGAGMADAGRLLLKNPIGEGLGPNHMDSPPAIALRWRLPSMVDQFFAARQQHGGLNREKWDIFYGKLLLISLGLCLVLTLLRFKQIKWVFPWMLGLGMGILLHAIVLATFSGPVGRYEGRVSWILVMMALVVIFLIIGNRKNLDSRKFK